MYRGQFYILRDPFKKIYPNEDGFKQFKEINLGTNQKIIEYNIIGDGACLFRSISFAMIRSESAHWALRNLVTAYGDDIAIKHQISYDGKNIRSHLEKMRPLDEWGGLTEMSILGVIFNFGVNIYSPKNKGVGWEILKVRPIENPSRIINLKLIDHHYTYLEILSG